MDRLRLLRVALEDDRVVLEAADELDHVDAPVERDVAERPLARVVLLVEEDELGPEVVEHPAGRDRRAHRRVQQLAEQRPRLRVVEVDATLVQVPRHGRERLAADVGALVAQLLQVGRARHAPVERARLLPSASLELGGQVVVERDEALDPEQLVVAPRDRGVGQRRDDRLEPLELERLREHALLLRLVGRVRQARDQRPAPRRLGRRPQHVLVAPPECAEVALVRRARPERAGVAADRRGHGVSIYSPRYDRPYRAGPLRIRDPGLQRAGVAAGAAPPAHGGDRRPRRGGRDPLRRRLQLRRELRAAPGAPARRPAGEGDPLRAQLRAPGRDHRGARPRRRGRGRRHGRRPPGPARGRARTSSRAGRRGTRSSTPCASRGRARAG